MSKNKHPEASPPHSEYKRSLFELRVELVKLQKEVIRNGIRILVVFEGRDAAGKNGAIKRITKHLSPRETRVVALGAASTTKGRTTGFSPWTHRWRSDTAGST